MIDVREKTASKADPSPRLGFNRAKAFVRRIADASDFDCLVSYVMCCRDEADARHTIECLRRNQPRLLRRSEPTRPSKRDWRRARREARSINIRV
jgi:hypothetical protein